MKIGTLVGPQLPHTAADGEEASKCIEECVGGQIIQIGPPARAYLGGIYIRNTPSAKSLQLRPVRPSRKQPGNSLEASPPIS